MDTFFLLMDAFIGLFTVGIFGSICWKGCLDTIGRTLTWRPSNYQQRNENVEELEDV